MKQPIRNGVCSLLCAAMLVSALPAGALHVRAAAPAATTSSAAVIRQASLDQAHFPDPAFRNFVGQYDKDSNGILSSTELDAVLEIECMNLGIRDLTGIEYFQELQYLDCSDNQLSSLDVSKNQKLTDLGCLNNQLTTLVIGDKPGFLSIGCDNNQLTALDVSGYPELNFLSCSGNNLSSLDLSHNEKLHGLICSRNPNLTALTFGTNSVLSSIDCKSNQLNTLDLSGLSALKSLDCRGNRLTSLTLPASDVLTSVSCSKNQLTALDLSKLSALESLHCDENQLTALDVSRNQKLFWLDCSKNQLTSLNLASNAALEHLTAEGNTYTVSSYENVDYRQFPGFDVTKVTDPQGVSFDQTRQTLTIDPSAPKVCYTYQTDYPGTGVHDPFVVTLKVEQTAPELFALYGSSMDLTNSLAMIFYAERADFPAKMEPHSYYFEISKPSRNSEPAKTLTVWNEDWDTRIDALYGVSFTGISAKEMSDEITVQIFNADGEPVSALWKDSVQTNAGLLLQNNDAALHTLVVDMLNYGTAAQQYFGYGLDQLANGLLTPEQKGLASEAVRMTDSMVSRGEYNGTSLNLGNNLALMLYFNGTPAEGMYAVISFEDHSGKVHQTRVDSFASNQKDSFYVTADEMAVADSRAPVTVTVYRADNSEYASVTDSIEGYLVRLIETDSSYQTLCQAILKFADSAKTYFDNRK